MEYVKHLAIPPRARKSRGLVYKHAQTTVFGLLQGPQLPIVVVYPSGVLPVNMVLTSMSRRRFDRLYAMIGRSLNM